MPLLRHTIYLDSLAPDLYRWIRVDGDAPMEQPPASLADIRMQLGLQAVDVIVPARDVQLTEVSLPRKNRQRARDALAFMIEDQLAVDIEQCHVVSESSSKGEQVLVAVVSHQRIRGWTHALLESELKVNGLYPASMCMPTLQEKEWLVVAVDFEYVVSAPEQLTFAVDPANFDSLVMSSFDSNSKDEINGSIMRLFDWRENRSDELQTPDVLAKLDYRSTDWPWQINTRTINLQEGEYQPAESMQRVLQAWLPAAVIFVMVGVVMTLNLWRENSQLQTSIDNHNRQIEEVYRKTFPSAKRIVNARAQTEHRLRELRSNTKVQSDGLLSALSKVAPVIAADKAIQLKRLSYRSGELNIEVHARDLQVLDQHKDKLSAVVTAKVEIQSASAKEGKVISRLRISGEFP